MTANRLKIALTQDQQKQIKDATGKSISELNINLFDGASAVLSEQDLDQVAGGISEIVITKTTDKSSTNLS